MFRASNVCFRAAVFAIALSMPAIRAQISQASLQGTVTDNSGAAVRGATVVIKNKGTVETRSVSTGAAGECLISNIEPADYSLTVSMPGFKTAVISNLMLHTGEHSTVDTILELGATNQEVTVESVVPLLETASGEVSHLVPASQVAELPLNGRQFLELTQLTPGATFIPRVSLAGRLMAQT